MPGDVGIICCCYELGWPKSRINCTIRCEFRTVLQYSLRHFFQETTKFGSSLSRYLLIHRYYTYHSSHWGILLKRYFLHVTIYQFFLIWLLVYQSLPIDGNWASSCCSSLFLHLEIVDIFIASSLGFIPPAEFVVTAISIIQKSWSCCVLNATVILHQW